MKKRAVRTGVGLLLLMPLIASCSSATTSESVSAMGSESASPGPVSGPLRIFAYADAFEPAVFDGFMAANPGVDVQKSEIASDEAAVAKLRGGFEADVVNTCAGPIDEEIAEGLLQPIDTSRIKDWDQIYPFFKDFKGVSVDGKTYMVPMVGGAYGIVYRPSAFPTPPTSWMDLFTTDKNITTPDDPLTNIVTAALALGYFPPQDMTEEQLSNVKDLLVKQKEHVVTYYQIAALPTLWENGEIDIAPMDISPVNQLEGKDIAFAPMNPPLAYACGFSIGANAQNLDAVYEYLNYALSPAVQTVQATNYSYLVSNKLTADQLPQSVLDMSGQDNIDQYDSAATFGHPADIAKWTDAWQSVKAS